MHLRAAAEFDSATACRASRARGRPSGDSPERFAGDKLAMQALFGRHRTLVYRWLLRFVGNETNAEDLLSEVFLDVWRQADRFEGRSSVSTWVISIARFKALSPWGPDRHPALRPSDTCGRAVAS
jgi:DNA-directed RNA polymerase specialized sigma24 family protein